MIEARSREEAHLMADVVNGTFRQEVGKDKFPVTITLSTREREFGGFGDGTLTDANVAPPNIDGSSPVWVYDDPYEKIVFYSPAEAYQEYLDTLEWATSLAE